MTGQGVSLLKFHGDAGQGLVLLHQTGYAELEGKPKFHGLILKTSEGGTHAMPAKAAPSHLLNL